MLLSLQDGIIYGPINSRRLGKSLGINLLPGTYKLCSFNCVYCHYGWTKRQAAHFDRFRDDLPTIDQVDRALEDALKSEMVFDYITFSGNGEPSLHPDFPEILDRVVTLRNRHRPDTKIVMLSDSSSLPDEKVRNSIAKIDIPVFKMDAFTEEKFKIINRPAKGIDFKTIIGHLADLTGIYLQTVFLDGTPCNTEVHDIETYYALLSKIKPVESHIYSIDRPAPKTQIRLVPPERLREIARRGKEITGVTIKAYHPR